MTVMGIDLGLARTGVAVGDSATGFAFPKTVIAEYHTERLLQKLCALAKEVGAERLVVGLPKNMDGSMGERAQTCAEIAKELQAQSGIETVLWDERSTTVSAYTALNDAGVYGKKRKQAVDAVAATIILESYLLSLKNT